MASPNPSPPRRRRPRGADVRLARVRPGQPAPAAFSASGETSPTKRPQGRSARQGARRRRTRLRVSARGPAPPARAVPAPSPLSRRLQRRDARRPQQLVQRVPALGGALGGGGVLDDVGQPRRRRHAGREDRRRGGAPPGEDLAAAPRPALQRRRAGRAEPRRDLLRVGGGGEPRMAIRRRAPEPRVTPRAEPPRLRRIRLDALDASIRGPPDRRQHHRVRVGDRVAERPARAPRLRRDVVQAGAFHAVAEDQPLGGFDAPHVARRHLGEATNAI